MLFIRINTKSQKEATFKVRARIKMKIEILCHLSPRHFFHAYILPPFFCDSNAYSYTKTIEKLIPNRDLNRLKGSHYNNCCVTLLHIRTRICTIFSHHLHKLE